MSSSAKKWAVGCAVAVLVAGVAGYGIRAARADVPTSGALTYAGVLENPDGTPINGSETITVTLYDAQSGGAMLCSGSALQTVLNGKFEVPMSDVDCGSAFKANADTWVDVSVSGLPPVPRTKVGVVPYALEAGRASEATGPLKAALDSATQAATTAQQAAVMATAKAAAAQQTADAATAKVNGLQLLSLTPKINIGAADAPDQQGCLNNVANGQVCARACELGCQTKGYLGGYFIGEYIGTAALFCACFKLIESVPGLAREALGN